jgi:hypothetical protein
MPWIFMCMGGKSRLLPSAMGVETPVALADPATLPHNSITMRRCTSLFLFYHSNCGSFLVAVTSSTALQVGPRQLMELLYVQ